jgi:hypothetical protein
MNTILRSALLCAGTLFTHATFAGKPPSPPPPPQPSSGTLVLDLPNAFSWGLAAAPSGTIYALGNSSPSDGDSRQLVLSSSDNGSSWSVLDDFAPPGRFVDFWFGVGGGIALDSSGNIYVSGLSYDNDLVQPAERYVRRSTDGGATWTTVDNVVLPFVYGGSDDVGIAIDATGDVYVSGRGSDADQLWAVRKGVGGTSYSTVDALPNSYAKDIFVHPTAGIFVVGQTQVTIKNTTSWAWLVRRSTDGGATWSNVDAFQLSSSLDSAAWGIGTDTSGNLYVVGSGNAPYRWGSFPHWVVRKSTNGGNSWTTVDDYQLEANNYSQARCIAADAYGNLFVAGRGDQGPNDGTSRNVRWVVRKSAGGTDPWTTADVFNEGFLGANAITASPFGNVFVGGGGSHWVIKKY